MPKATALRPWLDWYDSRRWRKRARLHKAANPVCVMCEQKGLAVPVEVADHIVPHRGDPMLFWYGELQSLCWSCHSKSKQQIERRGFTTDIGIDGWPTDDKHPSNKIT